MSKNLHGVVLAARPDFDQCLLMSPLPILIVLTLGCLTTITATREGSAKLIGDFPNDGDREFLSPDRGEYTDWVLVLDDANKKSSDPRNPSINP